MPSGVACACGRRGEWRIFVAERRRVQALSRDGVPLQVITPPDGCGSLYGVCVWEAPLHWERRLLVADYEARRVRAFALLDK